MFGCETSSLLGPPLTQIRQRREVDIDGLGQQPRLNPLVCFILTRTHIQYMCIYTRARARAHTHTHTYKHCTNTFLIKVPCLMRPRYHALCEHTVRVREHNSKRTHSTGLRTPCEHTPCEHRRRYRSPGAKSRMFIFT